MTIWSHKQHKEFFMIGLVNKDKDESQSKYKNTNLNKDWTEDFVQKMEKGIFPLHFENVWWAINFFLHLSLIHLKCKTNHFFRSKTETEIWSWRQDMTKTWPKLQYQKMSNKLQIKKSVWGKESYPCLWKDRDETKTQVSILNLLILIKLTSVEMVEKTQKDQSKPNLKEHETIKTIHFQMR